jgi:flagellar basal-body rod modification protein FlgD
MIPPVLAASAASSALGVLSSLASDDTQAASTSAAVASGERNDVIGQQEFLSLLVAQLQNQDPLSPLDSADFSAQLAQFSSLEQLMQINERLGDLGEPQDGTTLDPVGLLGRQVSAAGSTVRVAGGDSSELGYELAASGTVSIEVRNAAGNVVATKTLGELPAGRHVLDLDAVGDLGSLADGAYDVRVSVATAGGAPQPVATQVRGVVTGVDLNRTPPVLLIGDLEVQLTDVREVRTPDTEA